MKYKLCVALVCLLGALLLLTSCFGGSKDEYAALSADYTSLEKEYALLQEESEALKSELAKTKQQLDELGTRLDQTNAYAQILNVYTDTYRWQVGLPAQYGYGGPSSDTQAYLQVLLDATNAVGDDELSSKLAEALSLPQSAEKDRAWAEWHVLMAERMDTLTRP
jgi:septal ring factor EnvC (AmiA/AmiB activator)